MKIPPERLVVGTLVGSVLVGGLVFFCGGGEVQERSDGGALRGGAATGASPGVSELAGGSAGGAGSTSRTNLENLLRQLQKANRVVRQRIFHTIRTRREELEEPLAEILGEQVPELLVPAIDVAGQLQLQGFEGTLVEWAHGHHGPVRAASIHALVLYRYWTGGKLAPLLRDPDPGVLAAALEAAALVDDPPAAEIIALFEHRDRDLRRRAVNAAPTSLDAESLQRLCAIAREGHLGASLAAIQTLGRLEDSEAGQRCLLDLAGSPVWRVRHASLDALALRSDPLDDTGPAWAVLEHPETDLHGRIRAFRLLERRGPVDHKRVLALLPRLHPVEKLFAARALVSTGSLAAVPLLIDLLETTVGDRVDEEDRDHAVDAAHEILVELAGADHGLEREPWMSWFRVLDGLAPTVLRCAPRFSW